MNPDECDKACGNYEEPKEREDGCSGKDPAKGKLINITEYIPNKDWSDGRWIVLQDPYLDSVHVINIAGIEDIMWGITDLDNADRQAVARAIIREWMIVKGYYE